MPTTTPFSFTNATLKQLPLAQLDLHQHALIAREALPPVIWGYIEDVAGLGLTHQKNINAWQNKVLSSRVLRALDDASTTISIQGTQLPHPFIIAPMAQQRYIHQQGELATAYAASAQEAGLIISAQTHTHLREIQNAYAPEGKLLWFQLYAGRDLQANLALINEVASYGVQAIVVTVDAPVQGLRAHSHFVNQLPSYAMPHWQPCCSTDTTGLCLGLAKQAFRWQDFDRLQEHSPLPLILKGITHPDDAQQAIRLNCKTLIISNHGGRNLDGLAASAELLDTIAQHTAGRAELIVDGGIRHGSDAIKAMQLGASAVLIGRPILHGLAHQGALGVAAILRRLRDELEVAMLLSGTTVLRPKGETKKTTQCLP